MNENGPATRFPEELVIHRPALQAAREHEMDPRTWPEGERLMKAYGPHDMGKVIIKAFHPHLLTRKLAYFFVEDMGNESRRKLGTARVADARLRLLNSIHFVITLNFTVWVTMTLEQQVALLDHELCHCGVDGDSRKPVLIHHDVEEFGTIILRHGLWKRDVEAFAGCVNKLQGELFGEDADETKTDPSAEPGQGELLEGAEGWTIERRDGPADVEKVKPLAVVD